MPIAASAALFSDARSAVAWAEEVTSKCNLNSQIAMMMGGASANYDGMSPADWRDVAYRITNAVCSCRQPMATAYRVIYAGRAVGRDDETARALAANLRHDKAQQQVMALCTGVIRDERLKVHMQHNQHSYRITQSQLARMIGISRAQFVQSRKWMALLRESRETLHAWLDQAEREITEKLADMGMFG